MAGLVVPAIAPAASRLHPTTATAAMLRRPTTLCDIFVMSGGFVQRQSVEAGVHWAPASRIRGCSVSFDSIVGYNWARDRYFDDLLAQVSRR